MIINEKLYYWSNPNSQAEIDFLVQADDDIILIEVKAEENLRTKSLRLFVDKYSVKRAVRSSMSDYRREERMTNVPLYAISQF